jgi:RNA polymerase sigma factor (TIGR02999 family)
MDADPETDTSARLFAAVYEELRALAASRLRNESPGQTLQPTALVHEVYMRLVADREHQAWDSIGHFFAAAAESMRRILVDHARRKKNRPRKDGDAEMCVQLEGVRDNVTEDQLLELDSALSHFEQEDPEKARIVVLRYFGGLSIEQICDATNLSRTTVSRHLTFSRAWLHRRISNETSS